MDLGLDCVYVLSLKETVVRSFGSTGKKNGQFSDPAGLVSDQFGNTIIADSRNHRLQVKSYFTRRRKKCQNVTIHQLPGVPTSFVPEFSKISKCRKKSSKFVYISAKQC